MQVEMIDAMAQLGVAGLMGVLWVWERLLSRRRERQLNEAHRQLIQRREQLQVLVKLVHRNTQAIERFERTQSQLAQILSQVRYDMRKDAA